jgi:hypothetical protein
MAQRRITNQSKFRLSLSTTVVLGSVLLISGYVAGLYVASVAMVLSFAFFISGAWLLITGIHDKQD